MVVTLIGPSHAGKTTLLRSAIALGPREWPCALSVLHLDEALGSSHRSDADRAVTLIRAHASAEHATLLVDVGAGQIVQPAFRKYLESEPDLVVIAIWCDERTFRSRHSPETGDREVANNYSAELLPLWEACRRRGRLVDTSDPSTPVQWTASLLAIIRRLQPQG